MMQTLYQKAQELEGLLVNELQVCKDSGQQLAENEAEYRKQLRIEILAERRRGTPVTIIGDLVRGMPYIAELRQKRDCSEAIYKASQEAINVYKLRLRMIDAQMTREWNSGGRTDYL